MHSSFLTLLAFVLWAPMVTDAAVTFPRQVREVDLIAIKALVIEKNPKLSGSPGTKASLFFPSIGEPDCRATSISKKSATVWMGVSGESEEEVEKYLASKSPQQVCRDAQADIYFEPFEQSGNRSKSAFVRCSAPPQEQVDSQPLTGWRCSSPMFREYVQLLGQECEVTLIGDVSDKELVAIKDAGARADVDTPIEQRSTLLKFQVLNENQAFAVFGSDTCHGGNTTLLFRKQHTDGDVGSWTITTGLK